MPSIDQLKMFVATVDCGSFSGAGRTLGKGQSAISTGISNLEIDLGFELFDRSTRKPGLTEEGQRILAYARAVLIQVDDLRSAADSVLAHDEASVRIILDDAIMVPAIGSLLVEFGNKFPTTDVQLLHAVSPEIPKKVSRNVADVGLMFSGGQVFPGVEQAYIGGLPFVSVSHPDYTLAKKSTIRAVDLLPHRQILLRSDHGGSLDQFPLLSNQSWYASSFFSIRELLVQGAGWAYLPEHLAKPMVDSAQLKKLKFRFEHRNWSPPVECLVRSNVTLGPAVTWLFEKMKDALG